MAEILAREIAEAELVVPRNLPQEIRVDSPACRCASARSADGDGSAYRSRTAALLTFSRLPEEASTCSDDSLSARTVPVFS